MFMNEYMNVFLHVCMYVCMYVYRTEPYLKLSMLLNSTTRVKLKMSLGMPSQKGTLAIASDPLRSKSTIGSTLTHTASW